MGDSKKNEKKIYHAFGTFPRSNRNIDIPHIYDRPFSWPGTVTEQIQ